MKNHLLHVKIRSNTLLSCNHIECPKLETLLATKRKVHFFLESVESIRSNIALFYFIAP